jgi:hypothetical protein
MNVATAKQDRAFEQTTIRVVAIAQLKAGQKMAGVKDAEQGWFKIWPDKLGLINRGESYNIEFAMSDDGSTRFIQGSPRHVTPNGHQPSEPQEVADKVARTVQQTPKPRPAMLDPVKPKAQATPDESHTRHLDPDREKARHIYVDGVVNSSIAANQTVAGDQESLMRVTMNAFQVWNAIFGE